MSGLDAGAKDCWTYSKKIYHLQKIKLTKSAIFSLKLKVQTSKITLTWSVKYGIHGFGSANLLSYRCKYGSESANPNYVSGDLSTVYRIYLILLVEFDFFYNTVTWVTVLLFKLEYWPKIYGIHGFESDYPIDVNMAPNPQIPIPYLGICLYRIYLILLVEIDFFLILYLKGSRQPESRGVRNVSIWPNLSGTAAIDVLLVFSINFAVVFDIMFFRFRPSKARW